MSDSSTNSAARIVCLGEVLWDALPDAIRIGGAPFNVAWHLAQMGRPALLASAVGPDELGREVRRQMRRRGLDEHLLQTNALPTGFVVVELDPEGIPSYTIVEPAAWDGVADTSELREAVRGAEALVFGSLAQRNPAMHTLILSLAGEARLPVLDVNLRAPHFARGLVAAALRVARVVKLNEDELRIFCDWFGLSGEPEAACRQLAAEFSLETICVTLGAAGAALLHQAMWFTTPGIGVRVADTVGAGDAFLAALLDALLRGEPGSAALATANATGAWVATQAGGTPRLDFAAIRALRQPE